jgi:hypothetical protein
MKHALIRQAVTGLQGNGSSVKIANSEIHSCTVGIRLAGGIAENVSDSDTLQEHDLSLLNVNVHHNKDGVLAHGDISKPVIIFLYCNFDYNDDNGILISNWDISDQSLIWTNLYIINCSISNNFDYGIQSTQRIVSNIYIKNSTLSNNQYSGVYISRYNSRIAKETLIVTNSYFVKNRNDGIHVTCYQCKPSALSFHNNVFSENVDNAIELNLRVQSTGGISGLSISNNRFERNGNRDIVAYLGHYVIAYIHNNYFAKSRTSMKVTGNILTDTEVCYMFGNVFNEHSSTYDESVLEVEGVTATISNTTFANSSIRTLVRFKDGFDHTFEFNRFVNTSLTECFVSVDQKYDPNYTFVMDNNYWGTGEIIKIKTKVCDFFHDSDKAVAKITNIFSTEAYDMKVSTEDIDDFRFTRDDDLNATIIGGIVKAQLDLSTLGDGRFIVNRSLLITDSAAVSFKNVTVYFESRRGIAQYGMSYSFLLQLKLLNVS